MRRADRGFTLVELLVVIAIIGILMGMLLPAVSQVRETAKRSKCGNNLKNLITAMISYESQKGVFPPGRVGCDSQEEWPCINRRTNKTLETYQRPSTGGFAMILPELDESQLYRLLHFDRGGFYIPSTEGGKAATNAGTLSETVLAARTRPPVFFCPSDRSGVLTPWRQDYAPYYYIGTSSYAMCMGTYGVNMYKRDPQWVTYKNNGVFLYYLCRRSAEIEKGDGLGNTIFLGEACLGSSYSNGWAIGIRMSESLRTAESFFTTKPGWGPYLTGPDNKPLYGRVVNGAFNSYHVGGCNFAYGDGRIQFLNDMMDTAVYRRLATINGNYDSYDQWAKPPDDM
jgi:prepilin-type N-terminal cleavage/methylation domain-containing protein